MKAGDLVSYMSRTLLVIEVDETWVYAMELGSTVVGKYRKSVVSICDAMKDMTKCLA